MSEPLVWEWWDHDRDQQRMETLRTVVEAIEDVPESALASIELSFEDPQGWWRSHGPSLMIDRPQGIQPFVVFLESCLQTEVIGSVDWRSEPDLIFDALEACARNQRQLEKLAAVKAQIRSESVWETGSAKDVLQRTSELFEGSEDRLLHLHQDWDSYEFFFAPVFHAGSLIAIKDPDYRVDAEFDDH